MLNGRPDPAIIDILNYDYYPGANRLRSIADTAPVVAARAQGFYPGAGDYQYDPNGNLTHDPYKELQLTYNHLNLPQTLTHNSNGGIVTWLYDATGQKLQKKSEASVLTLTGDIPSGLYQAQEITADGEINGNGKVELEAVDSIKLTPGFTIKPGAEFRASIAPASHLTHDYVGNIEYLNGRLDAIYLEEGRVKYTESDARFEYTLKDHLGNTRVTFADLDEDGQVDESEILDESHYYPFGMEMDGDWISRSGRKNQRLFNGIERNEDLALNLDLAEFRGYDAATGRWLQIDPLSEIASEWTPYRFGFNNPVLFTDPFGLFESRDSAIAYAKSHGLKRGLFNSNIRKQSDGTYAIENREDGVSTSTSDLGGELGVLTAAVISPNDAVSTREEGNFFTGRRIFKTYRGSEFEFETTPIGGTAPGPGKFGNLNNNKAVGNFVTYVFRRGKEVLKVGKADAGRITKSSGLPTRIHQQGRKLRKMYPDLEITISPLGKTTTANAKRIERSILKKIHNKLGYVPKGNVRSFKPKR